MVKTLYGFLAEQKCKWPSCQRMSRIKERLCSRHISLQKERLKRGLIERLTEGVGVEFAKGPKPK